MNPMPFVKNVKEIALEKPFCFSLTVFTFLFLIFYTLSALEMLPEHETMKWREGKENVIDKGDHLIWIGMEIAPISQDIRKEFDIPRKVKGVFVLDEGIGMAKKQGVKTGDIIRSINRRRVSGQKSFVQVARDTKYYDGILIDIYRDDKSLYVTIPFPYAHGPLLGPNKGHWQLGSPIENKLLPYGELIQGQ